MKHVQEPAKRKDNNPAYRTRPHIVGWQADIEAPQRIAVKINVW